ncbi:MAG: hypothetical protein HFG33_01460 [Bacilli bacterium]|nr:hypothetical protein [Bacilli bacterium]
MNEIGSDLKSARSSSSISLEEASSDTNISVEALEQIESGAIGSFKDIFKLKEYLTTYSKYLGLDPIKIIDDFNEYMFEYTSKIPLDDLEKAMSEKEKELEATRDIDSIRVISPYLKPREKSDAMKYVVITIIIIILVAVTMIWAIKQVM